MRLDAKGKIKLVDKVSGDGKELSLGANCCSDFSSEFPHVLGLVFDGKIIFKDLDTDEDGTVDTFTGMKAVFVDINGNTVAETPLDGVNGKIDQIDTGYSKIIRWNGAVLGDPTATDEVLISKVILTLIGIDTSDMQTTVEISLGESDAPAKSPLASIDSNTGKKGISIIPADTKFEFELSVELR